MVSPLRTTRRTARGLTVLELMVAMAIATMIALLIASAIRLVVVRFADDTGIRNEAGREERIRLLMGSQLAWLELTPEQTPRRFFGADDGIEIRTLMCVEAPHERSSTVARYMVEEVSGSPPSERLVYLERRVSATEIDREQAFAEVGATADTFGVGGPERRVITNAPGESSRGRPILEGARSITFEYLRITGAGPEWLESWTQPETLPRGIRVSIEDQQGVVTSWVLPVVVTF
ncbi:MAG: PulJ/GspJ family protein [Phycisphaerales bacterium]